MSTRQSETNRDMGTGWVLPSMISPEMILPRSRTSSSVKNILNLGLAILNSVEHTLTLVFFDI